MDFFYFINKKMSGNENCNENFTSDFLKDKKSLQETTEDMIKNHQDAMLQQLKVINQKACVTNMTAGAVGGCDLLLLGCAAAGFATSTSVGCEQISVQASLSLCMNEALNCTINKLTNTQTISNSVINNVKIKLKAGGDISHNNFDIKSTTISKNNIINFQNSNVQTQITNEIDTVLKQFQDAAKDSKNGPFASQTAQRSVQDAIAAIVNSVSDTSVSDIVNSTINTFVNENNTEITLEAGGNITYNNIVANILNVNEYIMQQIQSNILTNIFTDQIKNDIDQEQKDKQAQANKGLNIAMGFFIVIAIICFIFFIIPFFKGFTNGNCQVSSFVKVFNILSIILLLFGFAVLIWGFITGNNNTKNSGIAFVVVGFILMGFSIGIIIYAKKQCNTSPKQKQLQMKQFRTKQNQNQKK
jgi:hypothetical protein